MLQVILISLLFLFSCSSDDLNGTSEKIIIKFNDKNIIIEINRTGLLGDNRTIKIYNEKDKNLYIEYIGSNVFYFMRTSDSILTFYNIRSSEYGTSLSELKIEEKIGSNADLMRFMDQYKSKGFQIIM